MRHDQSLAAVASGHRRQMREMQGQGVRRTPGGVAAEIFDRQIARSTIPLLVDVWAPLCGPCRMMAPAYEAAADELEPQVRLIKLNSDAEQAVAARLGIQGIPTMIPYHEGREVARTSGANPDCAMGARPPAHGLSLSPTGGPAISVAGDWLLAIGGKRQSAVEVV